MPKTIHQMLTSFATCAGLFAAVSAGPAQAVSVQDFFASDKGFSSDIRQGAERMVMSAEAYRNMQVGHVARAACIQEKFITGGILGVTGLDSLQGHLAVIKDSANEKTQSVAGNILKVEDIVCPAGDAEQVAVSAPKAAFPLTTTSVAAFNGEFPSGLAKVQILSLVFTTEALRTELAGYGERGKCIRGKFEVTRKENGNYDVPLEFQQAFGRLASAASVQAWIFDSIKEAKCGEEGPAKDDSKIANAAGPSAASVLSVRP